LSLVQLPAGCVMVKVKICGITNAQDALHAVECGADALGFVFYSRSPRCVDADQVRQIVSALPPFVSTVGLFVNEEPSRIQEIASICALDVVQLHGDETPAICSCLPPLRVVKALRVRGEETLIDLPTWPVSAILLDAWVPGVYGGTGHRLDWQLAARAARQYRIVLAGGLTPENVGEAVREVRPYAVDVSSGVEAVPGRKDPEKVAQFIRSAKLL
jgi:phosphoribosylanthranilate isomerase